MELSLQHLPADVLGLSEVARHALAGRPHPAGFAGLTIPDRLEAIPRPPEALDPDRRPQLVEALEGPLASLEPHVAVLESVRSLAEPGAAVVIAGQQPGFLGGPLYNVWKALHVVRLARALSEAWDRPVVPAFWVHGDDHDVAEVHHLWIQNPNLDLTKVGLAGISSGRVPLGRLRFDAEKHRLGPIREVLRQNLVGGQPREDELEASLPRDGETFARAFTRHLLSRFGSLGLVPIEPDWIRPQLSRTLANLLGADFGAALEESDRELGTVGLRPGIEHEGAAFVFAHKDGRRHALRLAGKRHYRFDDEPGSRTAAELAAEIVTDPENYSPGALLRPLVQDGVLPVAAYVGGWGELAYHAQLAPLRRACSLPLTPFVPRLSATIVGPDERAALARLDLDVGALLREGEGIEQRLAEGSSRPQVLAQLETTADTLAARLRELGPALQELDPGLAVQVKRTASRVRGEIEKLVGKAERVHANSSGTGKRHTRRLLNALLPRGLPQERVRGGLEFFARHGSGWLERLVRDIDPLPTEHLVVNLGP